jgi:hypothetical protein
VSRNPSSRDLGETTAQGTRHIDSDFNRRISRTDQLFGQEPSETDIGDERRFLDLSKSFLACFDDAMTGYDSFGVVMDCF